MKPTSKPKILRWIGNSLLFILLFVALVVGLRAIAPNSSQPEATIRPSPHLPGQPTGTIATAISPSHSPTATQIPQALPVATEQAMARTVHTQAAQTAAARPTFTPWPTPTPTQSLEYLPTITPLPVSTPSGIGALLAVPPDVLGEQYEIQNAYYFDALGGRKRFEIYAGSLAGSGDEETAQGVVVVRVLEVTAEDGAPTVKIAGATAYPTPLQVGPVRIARSMFQGEDDTLLVATSLGYEFLFFPSSVHQGQFLINPVPPRATLEIGRVKQRAGLGGFCWLRSCRDGGGIPTSSIPLVTRSPVLAQLRLPLVEAPGSLSWAIMKVPPPASSSEDQGSLVWSTEELSWQPDKLRLQREQELNLSLVPGFYVLIISAAWEEYGDTDYAFFLEVRE